MPYGYLGDSIYSSKYKNNEVPFAYLRKSKGAIMAAGGIEWKRLVGNEIGKLARKKFIQSFIGHANKCSF